MQDLTQDRINQVLDFVTSTASEAKDFAVTQAPLVAQEIINWYFWSSVFWAGICVAIPLAVYYVLYETWQALAEESNKSERDRSNYEGFQSFTFTVCLFSAFLWFIALSDIYCILKVSVAPRIVLIEELRKMTR